MSRDSVCSSAKGNESAYSERTTAARGVCGTEVADSMEGVEALLASEGEERGGGQVTRGSTKGSKYRYVATWGWS